MTSEDETTTVDDDLEDEPSDLDEEEDASAGDEGEDEQRAAAPRRALDGRTLAICALVAVIAAVLAGFVVSLATGDDDGDPQASEATLVPAEDVPDVVLPGLDGEDVQLSAYRGTPLIVNFWGSWCEPCVDEMPDLQRVHETLGDQVAFLGVNVNDSPEAAAAMVERTGVTYDLARDEDGALGRALDVTTFPTTFLIDAQGTVVDVSRREISAERLCEKVNQSLLGQSLGAGDCG